MTTVLVTAAGGGIGVGAIRSIQRETDYRIVGVDVEPKAGGLYRCDAGYVLPPVEDEQWAHRFADVIETEQVDVVIPLIDAEVEALESVRELVSPDISFLVARDELRAVTYDKLRTSRYLADRGCLVPKIVTGATVESLSTDVYPVVVKPRTGQGNSVGSGVDIVGSPAEAQSTVERRSEPPADLVVEEYVEGDEYTTEVLGTGDGALLEIVVKEAMSSDPYHRVTRDAPRIRSACAELFEKLDPRGVLNVQQIVRDEEVYTFEINPRFSASSSLTAAAGVNGFVLGIRDALGESIDSPNGYQPDLHLFRHPESVHVEEPLIARPDMKSATRVDD